MIERASTNKPEASTTSRATGLNASNQFCDQVVGSKRNGDSDYNASCKDGNRYHIFVDASGRVVVKKL